MRRVARILVALAVAAFAVPALACGYEKPQSTTAAPATPPAVAKADKAKGAKGAKAPEKAKAPPATPVATRF